MAAPPQIAGIQIFGELGRGAHSIVYNGSQNGRLCAVKLPRIRARWTRWIYREAVALARVRHAALPAVLEVGEVDGLPYLVMELAVGETLAERLQGGALDEAAAVELARHLLGALAAVHAAGLVHRDVKPRNIIIDGGGLPKLVDFGFATPVERASRDDLAGTAAYAAPEQFLVPGHVDGRADLFALGRVLFECLTGSLAHVKDVGPDEAGALLTALLVEPKLAEIVSGLLRIDQDDRYSSAGAVLYDLDAMVARMPLRGPGRKEANEFSESIVGRDSEIARLVQHCIGVVEAAVSSAAGRFEGVGAIATVRGKPGAGKTRLLGAVAGRLADHGLRFISVTSRQDDPPLATLARIFEGYLASSRGRGRLSREVELRTAAGNLWSVVELITSKQAPSVQLDDVTLGPDTLSEAGAEVLLRLACGAGPLVVLIDDIQWLDPASRNTLERVTYRISQAPLGLVLSERAADSGDHRTLTKHSSLILDLQVMDAEGVRALVCAHLGVEDIAAALVARTFAMADGTPLGVLAVLAAFLDSGALRPHDGGWLFDVARSELVTLPTRTVALLERRLSELPSATRKVLDAAAVIGKSFEDTLLARVVGVSVGDLAYATSAAHRATVIVRDDASGHGFVHDSLREIIVDSLAEPERRRIHQRIAEELEAAELPTSIDALCRIAHHFCEGETTKDPARTFRALRAAALAALSRYDNETALVFFAQAARAAALSDVKLPLDHHLSVGEAQLRLGRLDECFAALCSALEDARGGTERALVHGRIAWLHQTRAEPERAWQSLERAFNAVGYRMPDESLMSAASTLNSLARGRLRRVVPLRSSDSDAHAIADLLCGLHYQNARLGMEYGRPFRLLQSSVEALQWSERGTSDRTRTRARAIYGLVLTALKAGGPGARELARAQATAVEQGDPATTAFCVQLRCTAACLSGAFDEAIELARECVDVYGPWLELNEFCYDVANAELIESVRGRLNEAWAWINRALDRLRRSRTRPAVVEYMFHCARAMLAALGRDAASDPWLAEQLAVLSPADAGQGYHRLLSWGPRLRFYVETGDLGPEFENIVREFNAENYAPETIHPVVSEFYVAHAHARQHQCLRLAQPDPGTLKLLREATQVLRRSAKLPLLRAHALAAEGCLAWLEGNDRKATKLLADAEALAHEQTCPWVLYAVARTRAHMLRASGRASAAVDQARVAEVLAREHGAVHRARWIREEFHLVEVVTDASPTRLVSRSHSSSRTNRQLAALLQVARAPRRDLKTPEQATAILDELVQVLHAHRGALRFVPEYKTAPTLVARSNGRDRALDDGSISMLTQIHERGWPPHDPAWRAELAAQNLDLERIAALPLFLYDKPVGALCLYRNAEDPPFSSDDQNLLLLLSHQVPIALEIARLLFEREQLHASLQHAKKMEAMGALAGGLAHDFNNMLAAMRIALGAAQERAALDEELTIELDIISQATTRAAQLTSQLLSFSRHQPVPVAIHDVNQLVSMLEPMLRRVVGGAVTLTVELSPATEAVEVDQGSFDQALVNLLINARDAMPRGGKLSIKTRNVVLGEVAAQRANVSPGEYVEVEVADTGEGMSAETMTRIFEPFYTTKQPGNGTGLGLAMVYAFARNCGGSIEVASEVGVGTEFRLFLRRVAKKRNLRPVRSTTPSASVNSSPGLKKDGPDTILVVDDDDLVRRSIAKILERNGYRVVAANGSVEALTIAREQGARIALVILDVLMPGVTGPELGRRLLTLNLPAKMLFVSGFSPESIPIEQAKLTADMLLQKPFSQTTLLERVRELMLQ